MWGNLSLKLINDTNELQIQNSLADLTKIQSGIGFNYSLQQYKKKNILLDRQNVRKLWYHLIKDTNELQIQYPSADSAEIQSKTGLIY